MPSCSAGSRSGEGISSTYQLGCFVLYRTHLDLVLLVSGPTLVFSPARVKVLGPRMSAPTSSMLLSFLILHHVYYWALPGDPRGFFHPVHFISIVSDRDALFPRVHVRRARRIRFGFGIPRDESVPFRGKSKFLPRAYWFVHGRACESTNLQLAVSICGCILRTILGAGPSRRSCRPLSGWSHLLGIQAKTHASLFRTRRRMHVHSRSTAVHSMLDYLRVSLAVDHCRRQTRSANTSTSERTCSNRSGYFCHVVAPCIGLTWQQPCARPPSR